MNKKRLAIGESYFDKLIGDGCYYVDKTLLIKELIDKRGLVNLFTRPRRFGKTLNMYMLKAFFENNRELIYENKDKRHLFNGLKIEREGETYWQHFARYPVIMLSLKGMKQNTWESSLFDLKYCVREEYNRHRYLLDKDTMTDSDKENYRMILGSKAETGDYKKSIKFLSGCLYAYYNKNVIILIDEYDVPLESAWTYGYYPQMIGFLRSFFESAFKDNSHLEFAVLTGCLRISKESIFTGLNNFSMASIISKQYSEYFGFTQDEIDEMMQYYEVESKQEEMKVWYDGYLFGKTEVYNPWSVLNRVRDLRDDINSYPSPFWVNSSGNDIIRKLIEQVDSRSKAELETLMAGGVITKAIHEDITYDEIDSDVDNLWNFLFFTGYLKKVDEQFNTDSLIYDLKIPNQELHYIYRRKISEWFRDEIVKNDDTNRLVEAITSGDEATSQQELSLLLFKTISFYDTAENFYHGFLTGLLSIAKYHLIKSNRETGNGRSDIFMRPLLGKIPVVIIEVKIADHRNRMDAKCDEALAQIEAKKYADEFISEGFSNIIKYGIAFFEKECLIKKG